MGASCCKDLSTDSRSDRRKSYLARERLELQQNERGPASHPHSYNSTASTGQSPQDCSSPVAPLHGATHPHKLSSCAAVPPSSQKPHSNQITKSANPKSDMLLGDFGDSLKEPKAVMNINTANVHELCVLEGVTPPLANSIVDYRCTHGYLESVQDLLNVPGMTLEGLLTIQTKIKCDVPLSKAEHDKRPQKHTAGMQKRRKGVPHHLELVAFQEERPRQPLPAGKAVRLASWNLKCFSSVKAADPSVMEVVCLTILNHRLCLVAFQELGSEEALQKVCDELNCPTLDKVKSSSGKQGNWNCAVSAATGRMYQGTEYNGFLWDESAGVCLRKSGLLGKPASADKERFVRRPFIGIFQIDGWRFVLVSVHLKAAGWGGVDTAQLSVEVGLLSPMIQAISETTTGHKDVIVLGDFNICPDSECFSELLNSGYTHLLPSDVPTNISAQNLKGNQSYDNIWVSSQVSTGKYSGRYGVIREGLHTEASTLGSTGSTVSDHCPVWAEFQCI